MAPAPASAPGAGLALQWHLPHDPRGVDYVTMLDFQAEYLAGGAPPPAHPLLHVAPPAAPGGGAGAASDASAPLAAALSVASSPSSLGLDLPPAEAPELLTYAQLYGVINVLVCACLITCDKSSPINSINGTARASGFNVYGFQAESSELCWDSDSSGDAPPAT